MPHPSRGPQWPCSCSRNEGLPVCCLCQRTQRAACRLPDREQSDPDGPTDNCHGSHGGVRVLSCRTTQPFSGLWVIKARTVPSNAETRLPCKWMALDIQTFLCTYSSSVEFHTLNVEESGNTSFKKHQCRKHLGNRAFLQNCLTRFLFVILAHCFYLCLQKVVDFWPKLLLWPKSQHAEILFYRS